MFNRAPTFHVGAYILWTLNILYRRSCFLDLEYFMSANIFIYFQEKYIVYLTRFRIYKIALHCVFDQIPNL